MDKELQDILTDAENQVSKVTDKQELVQVSATFLGKNGALSGLMKNLRNLANEKKREVGEQLNILRDKLTKLVKDREQAIEDAILNKKLEKEKVDVTIPVAPAPYGTMHPIELLKKELVDYFIERGFELKDGPDIETDYYCFEALNVPKEHPAREMQDTFYIDNDIVLRTHTSAMQVRTMESKQPPIKMISTGNAYRIDEVDATHSPIFGQLEILVVDKNVTMADLIGTLEGVVKYLLGEKTELRVRPSYFPFTEPSIEADATCPKCGGKGCGLCKDTGFIELLGGGMVHPKVLEMSRIDSKTYKGFAVGIGLDRLAMIKYGVSDLRDLYENDINLLKQVK